MDAWKSIASAQSFENWKAIGAALAVGKAHALRVTGANAAWGRNYTHCFSRWMKAHGFGAMSKSVRSVAIELHEHVAEIESWRATLPERRPLLSGGPMAIARMLVRSGLLMFALTSAAATAKAFCRIMQSLSDTRPQRTESERVRSRSASKSRRQSPPPRSLKSRRA